MTELTPKGRLVETIVTHLRAQPATRELEPLNLPLYVVYENPSDYPGLFVLRRWNLHIPDVGRPLATSPDLSAVLSHPVLRGKAFLGRQPEDDPVIWGVFA